METKDYFSFLVNEIHTAVVATVDDEGLPVTAAIDMMDDEHERLIIKPKNGNSRSRPMDELRRIWDALQKEPAVHVDKVLNGSGTSRNQPETILANLPYIEWLRIDNKKHISYVGESTHPFGTLQEMDRVKAVDITAKLMTSKRTDRISTVIVSRDVNSSISSVQSICSGTVSTVERGIYQLETNTNMSG